MADQDIYGALLDRANSDSGGPRHAATAKRRVRNAVADLGKERVLMLLHAKHVEFQVAGRMPYARPNIYRNMESYSVAIDVAYEALAAHDARWPAVNRGIP